MRTEQEAEEEGMRWCYGESTPYSLEDLGSEAWLTGCPLCGDNCWVHATQEQEAEMRDYFANSTAPEALSHEELVAAIKATEDGESFFQGSFGPSGVSGEVVTPSKSNRKET